MWSKEDDVGGIMELGESLEERLWEKRVREKRKNGVNTEKPLGSLPLSQPELTVCLRRPQALSQEGEGELPGN